MNSRPRKVLNVFVSSPSDCVDVRELVEEVVAEVNATPDTLAARIELKAIRWENLPPGETVERDYQGRIDDLMKRGALDHFEIYLGFMRDRIGTPTRGHPSGTLSEFASARERRRTSGLPTELLFYFLRDLPSMTPEVAAIREEFEQRGFLYAVTPNREVFRARMREHLLHIVTTWWQWKNRIRRQLGNARVGIAYVATALLLSFLAFDLTTLYAINRAVSENQPEAAIELWHDRSDYLPIVRWRGGRLIEAPLRDVAASRLIASLVAQGFDPFTWKQQHLRRFETEALIDFARTQLGSGADSGVHADPAARLAWAVLADDWPVIRQLATGAALAGASNDPAELRGFIEHAPADSVRDWLEQDLGSALPGHVAARILEAVGRRAEPVATFAALDALHADRLGRDAKEFDLTLACNDEGARCATPAAAMLNAWLASDAEPPMHALELLLQWARAHEWSRPELLVLEPRLLRLLEAPKYAEISPALIRFLAKWHTPSGAKRLATRVEDHINGRISFGFLERAALIEALPMIGFPAGEKAALAVARRSAADAESLASTSYPPSDAAVQAAYVRFAAADAETNWRLHREWVRITLERRLQNRFPDFQRGKIDEAFSALVSTASPSRFLDLFEKPVPPVVDSIDGSLSLRRAYLLDVLEAPVRLVDSVVDDVCRSVPADESKRGSFYRALALHGTAQGVTCLRSQLARDIGVLPFLGDADDAETLIGLLASAIRAGDASAAFEEGRHDAPVNLAGLTEAAARLQAGGRAQFVAAALQVQPAVDPALLWPLASQPAIADQRLITAASVSITEAKYPVRIAAAITYLSALSRTADIWRAIDSGANDFVALMSRADSFDWLRIAQALPPPPAGAGLSALDAAVQERHVLLALESSQASPSAVLNDRLMGIRGTWFGNPLCRLLASAARRRSADALRAARDAPIPVDVIGVLPDSRGAFKAYSGWLLAEVLASLPSEDRPYLDRRAVSGWISDSDPVAARVMAGLTLAVLDQDGVHGRAVDAR